jgi:hypothetical protein
MTIREIAEQQGLAPSTVMLHRGGEPELWKSWEVGDRKIPGRRGRPEKEYAAAEVARYYDTKGEASPQGKPGPKRHAGAYEPDEVVGWKTIGARLGINPDTARGYPARYDRGNNPFPDPIEQGRYRWGDIEAWDDRRGKSGRPGPRTIPDGVPAHDARAHVLTLRSSGLDVREIAQASGVSARTVRRIASGELTLIRPDDRDALLALALPHP